jgi:methionyl-tRNA formyltransferase
MKIIIATVKSWNIKNAEKLKENNSKEDIFIITNHKDLTYEKLYEINPDYIFFLIGHGLFQRIYMKTLIV